MSAVTSRHVCRFASGALVVNITEAADAVHVYTKAPKVQDSEIPRLHAFMAPILGRYGEDRRPLHLSGNLVDYSVVIHGTDSAGAFAVVTRGAARGTMQ